MMPHHTEIEPPTGSMIARLDGCPNCVTNAEVPFGAFHTTHGLVALYKCTDCGHRWHTAWNRQAAA